LIGAVGNTVPISVDIGSTTNTVFAGIILSTDIIVVATSAIVESTIGIATLPAITLLTRFHRAVPAHGKASATHAGLSAWTGEPWLTALFT
jgi:hypothetical protein